MGMAMDEPTDEQKQVAEKVAKRYRTARNGWRQAGEYHRAIEQALYDYYDGRRFDKIIDDLKGVIGDE